MSTTSSNLTQEYALLIAESSDEQLREMLSWLPPHSALTEQVFAELQRRRGPVYKPEQRPRTSYCRPPNPH